MLRKGLLLVTALGLVTVSSPVARADMCFSYKKSGGGTLVAKGAKLPATNTCETLALFESGGLGGANRLDLHGQRYFHDYLPSHIRRLHSQLLRVGDLRPPNTERQPSHCFQ
jgi:hypothetical protein